MKRPVRRFCLFAATIATLFAATASPLDGTADAAEAKAKLAAVRGQIAALTGRLGEELRQRDVLGARLREADLGITAKSRRLEALRIAQAAAERHRAELRAAEFRAQHALAAERADLAAQVRAAYMLGPQERIKLLFSQVDPGSAGRMSAYYGYFARVRAQQISEINRRAAEVQDLVAQMDRTMSTLQSLRSDTAREVTDLQRARQDRSGALAAVTRRMTTGQEQLAKLRHEEQAEEALVAELAGMLQDFPLDPQQTFETLRGKLAWPVRGRMTTRYQEPRLNAASGLRWNGVLIETSPGAKVRAPYFGRVVYADWLQGLGLLLIIGHTGNYMTLYGHAEVLYKSVGDWVAPGDVIAGLSDSSGAAPQLYFEIREGRTPKDPKVWLKAVP